MIMAVAQYESGAMGDDEARAELAVFQRRRLIQADKLWPVFGLSGRIQPINVVISRTGNKHF
jgi:hypothetical protein